VRLIACLTDAKCILWHWCFYILASPIFDIISKTLTSFWNAEHVKSPRKVVGAKVEKTSGHRTPSCLKFMVLWRLWRIFFCIFLVFRRIQHIEPRHRERSLNHEVWVWGKWQIWSHFVIPFYLFAGCSGEDAYEKEDLSHQDFAKKTPCSLCSQVIACSVHTGSSDNTQTLYPGAGKVKSSQCHVPLQQDDILPDLQGQISHWQG